MRSRYFQFMERKFGDKLKLQNNKYFTLTLIYSVQRRNINNDEQVSPIVLRGFPNSLKTNAHIWVQLGNDHSLSKPIHQSLRLLPFNVAAERLTSSINNSLKSLKYYLTSKVLIMYHASAQTNPP